MNLTNNSDVVDCYYKQWCSQGVNRQRQGLDLRGQCHSSLAQDQGSLTTRPEQKLKYTVRLDRICNEQSCDCSCLDTHLCINYL